METFFWAAFYAMGLFPLMLETMRIFGINSYVLVDLAKQRKAQIDQLDELSRELNLDGTKQKLDFIGCLHSIIFLTLWTLGIVSFAWKTTGMILVGSAPFYSLFFSSLLFTVLGFLLVPYSIREAKKTKEAPVIVRIFYIFTGLITVMLTIFAIAQALIK